MSNCAGCGNMDPIHTITSFAYGEKYERCEACGATGDGLPTLPDVYFTGKTQKFANLCDDMGRPYEITSKRQKAQVMRQLGVSEAGDLVNGAPYGTKTWQEGSREYRRKQFDKDRPKIRETYARYLENVRRKG